MNDIPLQAKADDVMNRLRKAGDNEAVDLILALRMWGYAAVAANSAAMTALRGGFPMESER